MATEGRLRILGLSWVAMATLAFGFLPGSVVARADDGFRYGCVSENGRELTIQEQMRGYFLNYLHFEQGGDEEYLNAATDCEFEIMRSVFEKSHYRQSMAFIERQAKLSPLAANAVARLAFGLQKKWESLYLVPYYQQSSSRLEKVKLSTRFAFGLGVLSAYGRTANLPRAAAKYFEAFRDLFVLPAEAARTGYIAGELIAGYTTGGKTPIPAPPASLLSLAVPVQEDALAQAEEDALLRSIVSEAAGASAGAVTWVVASQQVTKLAERNAGSPVLRGALWLSSFALSVAADRWVEEGARKALEKRRLDSLITRLNQASAELKATDPSQRRTLIARARQVVGLALRLEAERNRELLRAEMDRRIELAKRPGDKASIEAEYNRRMGEAIRARGLVIDPMLARHVVRQTLLKMSDLPTGAQAQATLLGAFSKWGKPFMQAAQQLVLGGAAPKSGSVDLRARLNQSEVADSKALLAAAGHLSAKTDLMFLQLAALFQSKGDSTLREYAEQTLIGRAELMAVMLQTQASPVTPSGVRP